MELTLRQIMDMPADSYIYVDVRSEIEYQHGHIKNAVHWDNGENMIFPENKKLIVYCTYGKNSISFVEKLKMRGFDAYNLYGGYREWLIYNSEELDHEEISRYDRQIILSQVGIDGQKKLRTCLHKLQRTSFRQILPIAALKKLIIRQYAFTFSPCTRQNYARKSAHRSCEDRF